MTNDFWKDAGIKMGSLLWPIAEFFEDQGSHALAAMLREIGLRDPHGPPFVTGSRAYGKPRPDSDTDVCAFVDSTELDYLRWRASNWMFSYGGNHTIRIPGFDLLLFDDSLMFKGWLAVTNELIAKAPVSRAEAIKAFDKLRAVNAQPWQTPFTSKTLPWVGTGTSGQIRYYATYINLTDNNT